MKKIYCLVFCAMFLMSVARAFAGPFGFEPGMTKEQVATLVGKASIIDWNVHKDGYWIKVKSAPRPNDAFEYYNLAFSPTNGLVKIAAIGKDIETSDDGTELKEVFNRLHAGLVSAYGPAKDDFDFLKAGSIWTESHDFMASFMQKDRVLSSFWTSQESRGPSISLDADALSTHKGYVNIIYEYDGWAELRSKQESQQDSTLK